MAGLKWNNGIHNFLKKYILYWSNKTSFNSELVLTSHREILRDHGNPTEQFYQVDQEEKGEEEGWAYSDLVAKQN